MDAIKMKFDEMQNFDDSRLDELEQEMRQNLVNAKMQVFEDKSKLAFANKVYRKKVAQILTIKKQRKISKA